MMAVTVVALTRSRNLFAVVVLGGIYSFLMATVLVALDAVDVAMTEAAVGAGISTVLLLGALHPVSYTHLDVYKRQSLHCSCSLIDRQLLLPSAL